MNENTTNSLIIAIRDAENYITRSVNDVIHHSGLPYSVIEMIIDKIHKQLKDSAAIEFAAEQRRLAEIATKEEKDVINSTDESDNIEEEKS